MPLAQRFPGSHAFWDHDGTVTLDVMRNPAAILALSEDYVLDALANGGALYHPDAGAALLWSLNTFDHVWWLSRSSRFRGRGGEPPAPSVLSHLSVGLGLDVQTLRRIRVAPWNLDKGEALVQAGDSWVLIEDDPSPGTLRMLEDRGLLERWVRCNADLSSDDLRRLPELCARALPSLGLRASLPA